MSSSRPQSARSGTPSKYENYDMGGSEATSELQVVNAPATPPRTAAPPGAAGGAGGGSAHIDIFVRVKPQPKPSPRLSLDLTENRVEFNLPREAAAGYVNNQRENYEFRFNGVIGPEAKQDEVFERVARSIVTGTLEGYNGTIFAYGQTGSGKTFTITGGPSAYADRGIIPRTISTIFSEVTKRSDHSYSVHVSYLEIYNETGYDLLDPNREITSMEDLPQVHVMEDEDGNTSYRNLNIHRANNEEEALNLLFLGDTNRTISETPMNHASSRSHCIFTIYVEARKHGEDVVRRSKLNLVDLAGSERASKTGIDGTTLREAKYINLSLHYLEQVIIALQERSMGLNRPHVPYRNSKMTQVLRDSLGGNCRTIMVATISADQLQLDESISTCRFAMRVALVRNVVALNEEVDPALVIRRLRQEIRDLKEEVRVLRGGEEERGPLTPDEINRLQEQIEAYCADSSPDAALNLGGSMMFIRASFEVFKRLLVTGGYRKGGGGGAAAGKGGVEGGDADWAEQIKKLKLQIAQRDNEINILVGMIKRRDAAAGAGGVGGAGGGASWPPGATAGAGAGAGVAAGLAGVGSSPAGSPAVAVKQAWGSPAGGVASPSAAGEEGGAGVSGAGPVAASGNGGGGGESLMNAGLLADRNQAFELFRKSYRQNEVIEENKAALRVKYEAAKAAGAVVNESKGRIGDLRALIEQRRVQRSVARMHEGAGGEQEDGDEADPEEERCKVMIEKEKVRYKEAFDQLRGLKKEIEHLHMLLEQSRNRLQKDFDQWMALMARQAGATTSSTTPTTSSSPSVHSSLTQQQWAVSSTSGGASPPPLAPRSFSGTASHSATGAGGASSGSGLRTTLSSGFVKEQGMPVPSPALQARPSSSTGNRGVAGSGSLAGSLSAPAPRQAWGDTTATSTSSPAQSPLATSHSFSAGKGAIAVGAGGTGQSGAAATSSAVPFGLMPAAQQLQGAGIDLSSVDPQVLQAAKPYLTGNPEADQDILRFYIARQQLLAKLAQGNG